MTVKTHNDTRIFSYHFRYILLSDPVRITVGYSYAPQNLGKYGLNEDVVKLDLMMSKIKVNWSKFLTIR